MFIVSFKIDYSINPLIKHIITYLLKYYRHWKQQNEQKHKKVKTPQRIVEAGRFGPSLPLRIEGDWAEQHLGPKTALTIDENNFSQMVHVENSN